MSNLLKFTLGLNPTLPVLSDPNRDHAPALAVAPDGKSISLTFWSDRFNSESVWPNPKGTGELVPCDSAMVVAQRSSHLFYWVDIVDAISLGDNRWQVTAPIEGEPATYLRLKAKWCNGFAEPQPDYSNIPFNLFNRITVDIPVSIPRIISFSSDPP
ncbi:MAG: hypothetical protein R3F19_25580 [Verrucomicrobiales bacterium]